MFNSISKTKCLSAFEIANNIIIWRDKIHGSQAIYLGFPRETHNTTRMINIFDHKLSHLATRKCSGSVFNDKMLYCTFTIKNANLKNLIETAGRLGAFMYGYPCLFMNAYDNDNILLLREDIARGTPDFNPLKHYALSSVEITKIIL